MEQSANRVPEIYQYYFHNDADDDPKKKQKQKASLSKSRALSRVQTCELRGSTKQLVCSEKGNKALAKKTQIVRHRSIVLLNADLRGLNDEESKN